MKKLISVMICALLVCAFPIVLFAAEALPGGVDDGASESGEAMNGVSEDGVPEDGASEDGASESVSGGLVSGEAMSGGSDGGESLSALLSERFEKWVTSHLEEISVVITLLGTLFYQIRKNRSLTRSMGTMNNNAVALAEQSASVMSQALTGLENASLAVRGYDERISALLDAYRAGAEDRQRLEGELAQLKAYLRTAAASNIEFANELAELLGLANIPNCKKEEIGARHLAAVRSIKAAESNALGAAASVEEEVSEDDGKTA